MLATVLASHEDSRFDESFSPMDDKTVKCLSSSWDRSWRIVGPAHHLTAACASSLTRRLSMA